VPALPGQTSAKRTDYMPFNKKIKQEISDIESLLFDLILSDALRFLYQIFSLFSHEQLQRAG